MRRPLSGASDDTARWYLAAMVDPTGPEAKELAAAIAWDTAAKAHVARKLGLPEPRGPVDEQLVREYANQGGDTYRPRPSAATRALLVTRGRRGERDSFLRKLLRK